MPNSPSSRGKTTMQFPDLSPSDSDGEDEPGNSDTLMATTSKELHVADRLLKPSTQAILGPLPNTPKTYKND